MKAEIKKNECGGGAVTCYRPKKKSKPVLTFKGGGAVTCYRPKKKE